MKTRAVYPMGVGHCEGARLSFAGDGRILAMSGCCGGGQGD